MSEGNAIIELTSKGQEIMAKMASEHAEQTHEPTFQELVDELEALVKQQYPNEDLAVTYSRCYGIVLAHITKDQMSQIIKNRKAN